MPQMPQPRPSAPSNPYNGRFRYWYPAIADWLIQNPSGTYKDCAAVLGRGETTISLIVTSDLFRDYFAKRRQEYDERHDSVIRQKTTAVAELGLDIIMETLTKKRDSIPIGRTSEITMSALDRLGYAPKSGPTTQINVQANGSKVVVAPVTVDRLEEARQVLRRAQEIQSDTPSTYLAPPSQREVDDLPVEDDDGTALTISSE